MRKRYFLTAGALALVLAVVFLAAYVYDSKQVVTLQVNGEDVQCVPFVQKYIGGSDGGTFQIVPAVRFRVFRRNPAMRSP